MGFTLNIQLKGDCMELKKSLRELGFTDYEADAYLYLVKNGASEANQIYKEVKIPFGRVYDVLNSLASKGFIEIQNSRPKKYMIKSPKISFRQLIENKMEELKIEYERIKDTASKLEKEISRTKPEKTFKDVFWTTSVGAEDMVKTIGAMFLEVEKEVNIIPHPYLKSEVPFLISRIRDVIKEDIKIKILTSKDFIPIKLVKDQSLVDEMMPKIEMKVAESIDSYFGIIDNEKVVILQENPVKKDELLALMKIWNPDLAGDLKIKFNEMWNKAEFIN